MGDVTFSIRDDKLVALTPVPTMGEDIARAQTIIDKETFLKLLKEWAGIEVHPKRELPIEEEK